MVGVTTPSAEMRFASAVVTRTGLADASRQLCAGIEERLAGATPTVAVLLASAHFEDELQSIVSVVAERLAPRAMIGTTGEAVICGEFEYENQPAVALWAASLPGATVRSFHLSQDQLGGMSSAAELSDHLEIPPLSEPNFVLLGDPFSIDVLRLLDLLGAAYEGRPAVGGMASAGEAPGQNAVICDGQLLAQGAAGVAICGGVAIEHVVSQGCRPIGRPWVITRAERNVIHQLGGKTALVAVNEMLSQCTPQEIELARARGLLVGRVINEYQPTFSRGDFLIRNPLGFDPSSGAMAVNDLVRTGQTVQFHVRDEASADADLTEMLAASAPGGMGALLFNCNGRGTRLYSHAHHDARAVSDRLGGAPLAGLFCAGEIGPIGRRNFLHGHTASIAIFRPAGA